MGRRVPHIGLSACFFHADPERNIFKGKTLLYLEESMGHYVMSRDAIAYMIPTAAGPWSLADLLDGLDGLVLQGGSDVAPPSYGEEPLKDAWSGDAVRDRYEIDLVKACMDRDVPVLGICRGVQVINVALGGTLFQDIGTQVDGALEHRNWHIYDQNAHGVTLEKGTRLREIYRGIDGGRINSVHHQSIKDLGHGLVVEARAPDGVIEAARLKGDGPYVAGVQWHPEFQKPTEDELLTREVVLEDFLAAVRRRGA